MKANKGPIAADHGAQPSAGITSENYGERARAYIMANGGAGFVIRGRLGERGADATGKPATEPQWIAWIAYLRGRGVAVRFSARMGLATVPAEWPELFDREAPTSDRFAQIGAPGSHSERRGARAAAPVQRDIQF